MDVWILAFLGMVMGGGPTIPNPNRFKFQFFAGCAGEVRYGLLVQTNLWRASTHLQGPINQEAYLLGLVVYD